VGSTWQRRFPSARASSPSPSAQWGLFVGASCPRPRVPFPLCLTGPPRQHAEPFPPRPLPLTASWDPCQLRLPRDPLWTSTRALKHARRDPRPRRPPTHPSSLLSTARTRTRFPVPFRIGSLSLTRSALAARPRRRPAPAVPVTYPPEVAPSDPELRPVVRHSFPCSVSPIILCRQPISASPSSAAAVRRARTVTGRISPVQCPCVGPDVPLHLLKLV
jgi:hypothetical protein